MNTVNDIRNKFIEKFKSNDFVIDKTGARTIEVFGESFIADEEYIIKKPNYDYIDRELEWYKSQSLFVKDIPGETPAIWKNVSSNDGKINSNYGWCIWSDENYNQYDMVKRELISNRDSRRATMIYNRPSMHIDFNTNGMSDFMCTYSNGFFIRNDKLYSHYIMRSNDAVFGYNNDYAWAKYVQRQLLNDLNDYYMNNNQKLISIGDLIWTASSLHVYERHFKFIEDAIHND